WNEFKDLQKSKVMETPAPGPGPGGVKVDLDAMIVTIEEPVDDRAGADAVSAHDPDGQDDPDGEGEAQEAGGQDGAADTTDAQETVHPDGSAKVDDAGDTPGADLSGGQTGQNVDQGGNEDGAEEVGQQ
ncbi:MAG: hypothetical protein LBV00_04910, partial [Propionibacteriaceae bacterium]|nr:hypothetical protein [Propionibacteriaceae bacterium]